MSLNIKTIKFFQKLGPGNGKTIPFKMARNSANSSPEYKKPAVAKPAELTYEQKIMKLRSELSELKRGDEVLVRSPHTGWYYRRMIEENLDNFKYRINFKNSQIIFREDIIFIQENNFEVYINISI